MRIGYRTRWRQNSELLHAILAALDAHTAMGKQALNSDRVRQGLEDSLNHARLYDSLRAPRSVP